MDEHAVMTAEHYDRIDGRRAYGSPIKKLTLGAPVLEDNSSMEIAAQIWKEQADGPLELHAELPLHQVLDLMIFLGRSLLYFREAYRLPLLYDPKNPLVERIGIQGDAMPVAVCTDNPNLKEDIKAFSQAINDLGELTGDRLRALSRILTELEY